MGITWAVGALGQGRIVYRERWWTEEGGGGLKWRIVRSLDGTVRKFAPDPSDPRHAVQGQWSPSQEDLFADDWQPTGEIRAEGDVTC